MRHRNAACAAAVSGLDQHRELDLRNQFLGKSGGKIVIGNRGDPIASQQTFESALVGQNRPLLLRDIKAHAGPFVQFDGRRNVDLGSSDKNTVDLLFPDELFQGVHILRIDGVDLIGKGFEPAQILSYGNHTKARFVRIFS